MRSAAPPLALIPLALALACGRMEAPLGPRLGSEGPLIAWETEEPALVSFGYALVEGGEALRIYPARREWDRRHLVRPLSAERGKTYRGHFLAIGMRGESWRSPDIAFAGSGPPGTPLLRVTMIDVGWGDAILLVMPAGGAVLIDAGSVVHLPDLLGYLAEDPATAAGHLDVVCLTHLHEDHIGGFVGLSSDTTDGLLERFAVDLFLDTPTKSAPRALYADLLAALRRRAIPRVLAEAGETSREDAALAWDPLVGVEVLSAGNPAGDGNLNNDSLVLRVVYGEAAFLLTGDAEMPVEEWILRREGPLRDLETDILKVGHHGQDDATGGPLLALLRPRVALISIASVEVGGALPAAVTLRRLAEARTDVFRTDCPGPGARTGTYAHLTVLTDGEYIEVRAIPSRTAHP